MEKGEARPSAIEIKVAGRGGQEIRRVVQREGDVVVGRKSADIDVREVAGELASKVSDRHLRITYDGSHWYVTDLGSRNGTFVADWDEGTRERGPWRRLSPDRREQLLPQTRISLSDAVRIDRSGKSTVRG